MHVRLLDPSAIVIGTRMDRPVGDHAVGDDLLVQKLQDQFDPSRFVRRSRQPSDCMKSHRLAGAIDERSGIGGLPQAKAVDVRRVASDRPAPPVRYEIGTVGKLGGEIGRGSEDVLPIAADDVERIGGSRPKGAAVVGPNVRTCRRQISTTM